MTFINVKINKNTFIYLFIYLFKKKDSTDVVKREQRKKGKNKAKTVQRKVMLWKYKITTELSSANCRTHPLRERKRDRSINA